MFGSKKPAAATSGNVVETESARVAKELDKKLSEQREASETATKLHSVRAAHEAKLSAARQALADARARIAEANKRATLDPEVPIEIADDSTVRALEARLAASDQTITRHEQASAPITSELAALRTQLFEAVRREARAGVAPALTALAPVLGRAASVDALVGGHDVAGVQLIPERDEAGTVHAVRVIFTVPVTHISPFTAAREHLGHVAPESVHADIQATHDGEIAAVNGRLSKDEETRAATFVSAVADIEARYEQLKRRSDAASPSDEWHRYKRGELEENMTRELTGVHARELAERKRLGYPELSARDLSDRYQRLGASRVQYAREKFAGLGEAISLSE